MTTRDTALVLAVLAITTPAQAGQALEVTDVSATSPRSVKAEGPAPTKLVPYGPHDVIHVNTRVRFTTLIVLPKDEIILDYVCGDKDVWVVDGQENFAYVKPSKEGLETNLNLVTQAGNIYSFILTEVSGTSTKTADLKVFVTPTDPVMADAAVSPRRLVSARELEETRHEAQRAKDETERVRQQTQDAIDQGIAAFVKNVRFAYRFEAGKKPFNVRAMYHDDRFTYIQARPEETPTLMEVRDGKPNLVNFTYTNDRYMTDRIIDSGYLAIGKQKLHFARQE
jgi:type IV secretory pathway VirB9-like protein